MVTGVPGKESTFYNLEIIRSLLRSITNDSIANEIMVGLPPDEAYTIKDRNGNIFDKFYVSRDDSGTWINASTMGKKNSNLIYFKDTVEDLDILINYRARDIASPASISNDNNFDTLLRTMKMSGLEVHSAMNPLLQEILGYKGSFTVKEYNYGVTLMYPSVNGSDMTARDIMAHKKKALLKLLNKFPTQSERDMFIGSWHGVSDFATVELPIELLEQVTEVDGTVHSGGTYTVRDYFNKVNTLPPEEIRRTIYISTQAVIIGAHREAQDSTSPARLWNNNLYFRFTQLRYFKDVRLDGPYRFLGGLIYLYEMNALDKEMKVKYEKVNYVNTPEMTIPLEDWSSVYPIEGLKYLGKKFIRYPSPGGNTSSNPPYMYDKIAPIEYNDKYQALVFEIGEDETFDNRQTLMEIFKVLRESNSDLNNALKGNILDSTLNTNTEYLRTYLMESSIGSVTGYNPPLKSGDDVNLFVRAVDNVTVTAKGIWESVKDTVGSAFDTVDGWIKGTTLITYDMLGKEDFAFKSGKTYIFKPVYTYPSGTMLVDVGDDYYSELNIKSDSYKLKLSKNEQPRIALGNSFDLINQNIAQLNDENTPIGEVPINSRIILPTGAELLALGNGEYLMTEGISMEVESTVQEAILWEYFEKLNVKVGASLNLLNGVKEIRLPTHQELTGRASEAVEGLTSLFFKGITDSIMFSADGVIKTGKINKGELKDNEVKSAFVYPVLKLDDRISVSKLRYTKDSKEVYLVRDLGMSVDPSFVKYLKDGIVDVNVPNFETGDIDLADVDVSDSNIGAFKMKNFLTGLSRFLYVLRRSIPMILVLYSISVMVFLILFSVNITRNFIDNVVPENFAILVFKIFSLFSVDEMYDMNIPLGFFKSFLLMAVGIIWWNIQNK